ncbi:MAG TPA: hypothetical protein VM432_04020 [Bdellovibrionales bacterium]|nr:hypothetical protein [Bdellovibrionales bacterium]
MNRLLAFVVFMVFGSIALADKGGAGVSGGGLGVRIEGKAYLLDLADYDLHKNAATITTTTDTTFIIAMKANNLPEWLPFEALTRKLTDLEKLDPVFASAVFETLIKMEWVKTALTLEPTPDRVDVPVNIELLQLARRDGPIVRVQSQLWDELDEPNRVALVIHEAVAALAAENVVPKQVRALCASLFSTAFYEREPKYIAESLIGFPAMSALRKMQKWPHFTKVVPINYDYDTPSDIRRVEFVNQAHFYFYPTMRIKRVDGGEENLILSPGAATTPYMDPCRSSRVRMRSAFVEYLAIDVVLPKPVPGGQPPKVTWALKPFVLKIIVDCGGVYDDEIKILKTWAKTVVVRQE